ncbi:uncharacterized protein LOC143615346 [Bidens hawaiensis]|uniref:uncharacterized protein LOC143615346 n=1 Tax=Bidens hawaiensis TaxID=980011 RepID=UPI00404A8D20
MPPSLLRKLGRPSPGSLRNYFGHSENIIHRYEFRLFWKLLTINYLLSNTTIEMNASNREGLMDILAKGPKHVKDQEIIVALMQARVIDAESESLLEQIFRNSRGKKNNDDWLDKKRNTLMVVASLIATMAFQAGLNPPGGVWQDDDLTTDPPKKAGYAVMAHDYQIAYHTFLISNTVGFVSTLSIILLLISGLHFLKGRFFMWILMVIMWVATASMSLTYVISIFALTPNIESHTLSYVVCGIVFVWFVLVTLLAVGHTFRILKFFKKLVFPGRPYSKMPKV